MYLNVFNAAWSITPKNSTIYQKKSLRRGWSKCWNFMFSMKRTFMKSKSSKMRQVALRLPARMLDRADRMADHVRGGRSEILRRAIALGLPHLDFFASDAMKTS